MNYIVFDLEATCSEKRDIVNEIIEIGAVKINDKLEIVEHFQKFVKPILNVELTDFCKKLTSITQENIDTADTFEVVSEQFKKFLGENYRLCSWGFYDKNQLLKDCELHKIDNKWIKNHISLKHQHQFFYNLKKCSGVSHALKIENLIFEGTKHRGIDDAINISKIFCKNFSKWNFNVTK